MSMPDLWSPESLPPRPSRRSPPAPAIVPRERIDRAVATRPTAIENLASVRDREMARIFAEAWEDGYRTGMMAGATGITYGDGKSAGAALMAKICDEVARKHGMPTAELMSERRTKEVVVARHEAMWRCFKETSYTPCRIGKHFGDKDRTTILNGVKRHEERLAREAEGK